MASVLHLTIKKTNVAEVVYIASSRSGETRTLARWSAKDKCISPVDRPAFLRFLGHLMRELAGLESTCRIYELWKKF